MKRLDRANPQEPARVPLLRRVRGAQQFPIDDLVSRQLPKLRRWVSNWLPSGINPDATTDIVHESLRAFLRQAVLDRIGEGVAQEARHLPAGRQHSAEVAHASESVPLMALIGIEGARRYRAAVSRMPAEDREAVVARLELGYNYDQIALVLGKSSADSARKAVARSLGQLATEMDRAS